MDVPRFENFQSLPAELRGIVWRLAFENAAPSTTSIQRSSEKDGGILSMKWVGVVSFARIALSCKEAHLEWNRVSHHLPLSLTQLPVIFPKTVFLLDDPQAVLGSLNHASVGYEIVDWKMKHVAFVMKYSSNLMRVFETLSRILSLESITVVAPDSSRDLDSMDKEYQCHLASELGRLIEEPSQCRIWDKHSYVGLLLRGHSTTDSVRRFYSGIKSPQIRLLMHQELIDDDLETWERSNWVTVLS